MRLRSVSTVKKALDKFNVYRLIRDRLLEIEQYEAFLTGDLIDQIKQLVEDKDTTGLLTFRIKLESSLRTILSQPLAIPKIPATPEEIAKHQERITTATSPVEPKEKKENSRKRKAKKCPKKTK